MNRERLAWTVSLVLIALLAFQIPASLAQRDDDYAFVGKLVEIQRQITSNYVDPVDENKLRDAAIEGMLSELDPFSVYVPPAKTEEFERMLENSFKGVGIQLDQNEQTGAIEVVTPIDGSPALKAGVLAGDQILKVNGESIEGLRLPEVIKKIAGPLGSDVALTVKHATGETADIKMTREEIVVPTVKGYQRNPDNTWDYFVSDDPKIAYLRITQFTSETYDRMKEVMNDLMKQGMDGLILDLRFNPGGRLDQAVQIVDMFVDHGVIVSTKGRNRPEQKIEATSEGTLPKFPMIVLVNEHSASASEIVSGSLKDNNRALVIGTRTYGKGSVQEVIPLDSKGGELKLTVAYYYLPSGRLVHKKKDATDWGVEPNITVPMDVAAEGRVLHDRLEQELMKRPMPKAATNPKTPAATTQVVDTQLQRAVDTMVAVLVLDQNKSDRKGKLVPPITEKVSPLPTTSTATPASQSAPAMPVVSPAPTTKSSPTSKKATPAATTGTSK